jgi:hypothetical protein
VKRSVTAQRNPRLHPPGDGRAAPPPRPAVTVYFAGGGEGHQFSSGSSGTKKEENAELMGRECPRDPVPSFCRLGGPPGHRGLPRERKKAGCTTCSAAFSMPKGPGADRDLHRQADRRTRGRGSQLRARAKREGVSGTAGVATQSSGGLDRLIAEGHGDVLMFEGLCRGDPVTGAPAEVGMQELRSTSSGRPTAPSRRSWT